MQRTSTRIRAIVLATVVGGVLGGCQAPEGGAVAAPSPAPAAPEQPPTLSLTFASGATARFRRVIESTSEVRPPFAKEGTSQRLELRSELLATTRVTGATSAGEGTVEARFEAVAWRLRAPFGEVDVDTRHPETMDVLAKNPETSDIAPSLKGIGEAVLRYVLRPDGSVASAKVEGGAGGEPQPDAPRPVPGINQPFGTLPFGRLEGDAHEGAAWPFSGTLEVGIAGMMHDEPLPVSGTWTVAGWNFETGEARLVLKGKVDATRVERGAGRKLEAGDLSGEAIWSAKRGVVVSSKTLARVVIADTGKSGARMEWTLETSDELTE